MSESAFPIPLDERPGAYPAEPGLTKREWFAGQAMKSILAHLSQGIRPEDCVRMAEDAYFVADAMLEAGSEPKPEPVPQHLIYDAWTTPAVEHRALQSLSLHARFDDLPAVIRDFVAVALKEIEKAESGIPF